MAVRRKRENPHVFINCPFDGEYLPIFRAIVFTVSACGYVPRCTLEHDDASQVRIEKIYRLVDRCALGIHDISRTELDVDSNLPRFNMPFELGIFLGAKRFGVAQQKKKRCLILDRERYRFQKFLSDIGGQDVRSHRGDAETVIGEVRDWIRTRIGQRAIPGPAHLRKLYTSFRVELPRLCEEAKLDPATLTFTDFHHLVQQWLKVNLR